MGKFDETVEFCLNGMALLENIEEMKSGYEIMADINLKYAEIGIESDLYELEDYEVRLASGSD